MATKLWKFLYTSFTDPLLVFMRRYWVYLDLRNFFLNFHTSPALHRGGLFLGLSACNFISFLSMWYIFFVISLKNWFLKIFFNLFGSMLVWDMVRARPYLISAHLILIFALETIQIGIKSRAIRAKNQLKIRKNVAQTFLDFFAFLWLKH